MGEQGSGQLTRRAHGVPQDLATAADEVDKIIFRITTGEYRAFSLNPEKRVAAREKLNLLKTQMRSAVEVATHEIDKNREIAKAKIDYASDKYLETVKTAYTTWLVQEGFEQKRETLRIINSAAEQLQQIQKDIERGGAAPKQKELMIRMSDDIWLDLYKKLYQEAAERILQDLEDRDTD